MRFRGWLEGLVAVALALCLGCARQRAARFPLERIPVPDDSTVYTTAARADGVVGGKPAERLQAEVVAALAQRGGAAEADGALAATASWLLNEVHLGRALDASATDAASRHFGYSGVVSTAAVFGTNDGDHWREALRSLPSNLRITRYGICVSPKGFSTAVVFGSVEMTHETIPRAFEPGQSVTLKGEVAAHFTNANVFLTKPDGTVEEKRMPKRMVEVTFALPTAGRYRLEVMGDGASGPVIVSNVPLFVGVEEARASGSAGAMLAPEAAEERLLALLNGERKAAGLTTLRADAELRELALGHTNDMVDHGFFAHVSPTTGTPSDRARRSGVLVSIFGENVSLANTPEAAHQGLMESPGHRANMLRAEFTHVGIGVEKKDNELIATLVFGRRPSPSALPTSVAQVEAAILALRASKGLAAATPDVVYRAGAQAGARAFAAGDDPDDINSAVDTGMKKEVERLRSGRPGACAVRVELLELAQLNEVAELSLPQLRRFGVGAEARRDSKGARLSTVFMLEGVPCGQRP